MSASGLSHAFHTNKCFCSVQVGLQQDELRQRYASLCSGFNIDSFYKNFENIGVLSKFCWQLWVKTQHQMFLTFHNVIRRPISIFFQEAINISC